MSRTLARGAISNASVQRKGVGGEVGCRYGAGDRVKSSCSEARSMTNISRIAASALFLTSGTLHFFKADTYERIVPPGLPNAAALVVISGAAEIAGAIGLSIPKTRRAATFGLIALLVAVFPANIYMAIAHEHFAPIAPAWLLYARLPLQAGLVAWVWTLR